MDKRTERTQVGKEQMIEALELTLGIVTEACIKTGLSRTQHYKWYKNDEDYRKAVDSIDSSSGQFISRLVDKSSQSYKNCPHSHFSSSFSKTSTAQRCFTIIHQTN